MTTTSKKTKQPSRSDIMHDIEGRHFGRCIDQLWNQGRTTLIELMDYPKAQCSAIIIKQYNSRVPTSGSGKPWPDLISAFVYLPAEGNDSTWAGLEKQLYDYETKKREPVVDEIVDEAAKLLGL